MAKKEKKVAKEPKVGGGVDPNVSSDEQDAVSASGKAPQKREPTGRFEVVQYTDGYRMYNEFGAAVSPVVKADERTSADQSAVSKLKRDAARNNALKRSREIRTPSGHQAA